MVTARDVDQARQQLAIIGDIKKQARRGGLLRKLLDQSESDQRQIVKTGEYRAALVAASTSRKRRSASEHFDLMVELLRAMGDHHSGTYRLTDQDRRVVMDGIDWHEKQARGVK